MSLGLNDLRKKTSAPPIPTENWARPTTTTTNNSATTARPWAAAGLSKSPKARKTRAENSDAFMSDEWSNDYTSSIHAFDMENQSALGQLRDAQISLKEQAIALERKIKRAAMGPFEIMKSVLRLVQK